MRPLNPTLTFGDAKPPSQRKNARRAKIWRIAQRRAEGTPIVEAHDIEIERDGKRRRCSCSCGFQGPWRLTRKTAQKDAWGHDIRIVFGER